jgi:CheY-like chemotaxis protein
MTLLIVEDNPAMRRLIRSLVQDLADRVEDCGNGVDAVAIYRERRPDLVLMDIELPGMDGILATRAITAEFPAARILILTQYADGRMRLFLQDG